MAIPAPQRSALEFVARRVKEWWPESKAERLTDKTAFTLDSKTIYLLGVCIGAPMRKKPNLHIAVFGTTPPGSNREQFASKIPECRFGGLITGPDREGRLWVHGLKLRRLRNGTAILCRNGRKEFYRWA